MEPTTGEQFFLQFTHVDSECYQLFLDQFAQAYPDSLNMLQVDNEAFYKAKALVIPANMSAVTLFCAGVKLIALSKKYER
ncbi:hypothetical protein H6F86_17310 [Phormidium sp. FACHB-592]|uniref:Uncharacterized protein n=1 Tax=Stenomitos frigidus AS-A4 TaxID=2933935 RepID=A0ABV0KPM7_9CYAN|nr:hypothetical protein [Phormidium sp. FACHB-592]MBD2075622.1 hypothetical protein [Phormidium sp. FACHB-592]